MRVVILKLSFFFVGGGGGGKMGSRKENQESWRKKEKKGRKVGNLDEVCSGVMQRGRSRNKGSMDGAHLLMRFIFSRWMKGE